jgi:hypothetical protein
MFPLFWFLWSLLVDFYNRGIEWSIRGGRKEMFCIATSWMETPNNLKTVQRVMSIRKISERFNSCDLFRTIRQYERLANT